MAEGLRGLLEQLKSTWKNLPRQAKILIPLISGAILVALIALTLTSGAPSYTLLYSNLSADDLHDIQIELSRMGIRYRLADNNSIYVPSDIEPRVRLQLSELGLPRGDTGYSIFKERNLGETFFDYERKYQEATEKKLKRAIESLEPVRFATVNITPMEESVFIESERPAKASVILQLKPGARLTRKQINGIIHLVAGAVKGLDPENVFILDDKGNMLAAGPQEDEMDEAQWRLEHKSELERMLARKIRDLLVPLVGLGGFTAEVTVETDFDVTEVTRKTYSNEEEVITKETTLTESSQGVVATGLPPGTASNVVSSAQIPIPPFGQPVSISRSQTTKEYLPSETIQKLRTAPGKIKRVSVSVLLDYKRTVGPDGKVTKTPWTAQELRMIEENIKSAVGYDQSRGDVVKVNSIQFDTYTAIRRQAELRAAKRRELFSEIAKYASVAVMGVILLFLVRFILNALAATRAKPVPAALGPVEEAREAIEGKPKPELKEARQPELEKPEELSLEELFPELSQDEKSELRMIEEKVKAFAEHEPEIMAKIIRSWLEEDESVGQTKP